MSTFKMRLDVSRCIGCRACEIACSTVNDLNPSIARNWVPYLEAGKEATSAAIFSPYLCSQCEDPPCVPACPTGASFIARDGRVLVCRDLCIGCGMCVEPCPYDARVVDRVSNKLEKCDLCEGRVKRGLEPACFSTCPAEARFFEEVVEIDGKKVVVAVGDMDRLDAGSQTMKLATDLVNPKPLLEFSGRSDDLEILRTKRPPLDRIGLASQLWLNGVGVAMQVLGFASMAAMTAMVGLRTLRSRSKKVAQTEQKDKSPNLSLVTKSEVVGSEPGKDAESSAPLSDKEEGNE